MFANVMKFGGAAGLLLSIAFLPAAAAVDSGTHREEYRSTEAIGTQPEEYGNPPAPKPGAKPASKPAKVVGSPGSPAKIKATQKASSPLSPGTTQPGEYGARDSGMVHRYDTVHNVRVRKEGAPPESVLVAPPKRGAR